MNEEGNLQEMPRKDVEDFGQKPDPYMPNSPSIRGMQRGHYRAFAKFCQDRRVNIPEGMMWMIEKCIDESYLNVEYGSRSKWRKPAPKS